MTEQAALRPTTSLQSRGHMLAEPTQQLAILDAGRRRPAFDETLRNHGLPTLTAARIEVLQVNVGKLCNMTCRHCHVDAGPDRRESMTRETLDACLRLLADTEIGTLDLTGGAPEMNPHFRRAVETASRLGRKTIDRCNLTILTLPRYADLPAFLAGHGVEIVASLPCYLEENVDLQRGDTAFARSIEALRTLNQLGYGQPGSRLELTLVYNPTGHSLPPDQQVLETAYREQLRNRFGIEFSKLYTIANMPISRFLEDLLASGHHDEYMEKLVAAFNPAAVAGLMCRNTLSVGWDGRLFDCDFNQMLDMPLASGWPQTIFEVDAAALLNRPITTASHCYGCTAGAGSGCQGAITDRSL